MITKEVFIRAMERLAELDRNMNTVDTAMKSLDPDFCRFYIANIFDITIEVLESVFNDEEQWINYFAYERDWLRNFELGDVTVDDEPLKIEGWGDVYDFLIKNMKIYGRSTNDTLIKDLQKK